MTAQAPKFSILIVNYNGLHHLQECLDSLQAQVFQDFEVVFVDNASRDGSVDFVRNNFPQIHLLVSPVNLGFAGGNNLGIPHCRGEWIFFLNNDTRVDEHCLAELANACDTLHAGAVACFMVDYYHPSLVDSGGDTLYTAGPTFTFRSLAVDDPLFASPREITAACGGASAWHRDVLAQIGAFDEDFFLNFEDLDLSMRTRHAGYTIWLAPSAKVYHKGSATIGHNTRTSVYYCSRNLLWLRIKNYPTQVLLKHLFPMLVTASMTFFVMLFRGCGRWWFEGRRDQIALIPKMLGKRRQILSHSKLTADQFDALLRKDWLRERLRIRKIRKAQKN